MPSPSFLLFSFPTTLDSTEQNYGYFALISNGIKDPMEALELYRAKDLIEKAFGSLKERLNMMRQFVSSEDSLDGKLFVQFLALIYLSRIQKAMLETPVEIAHLGLANAYCCLL